jgi:hypothetical protein
MRQFLFLLVCLPLLAMAQPYPSDYISWNAKQPLTWNDYLGSPDPTSDAAASTNTKISIDFNMSSTGFTYKVKSFFSKQKSWAIHKSAYILSHEQGHFDIAEIFARKLHKEMSEYRFNTKTYQKDLQKIYQKLTNEMFEMQSLYDAQTNHSIDKEKQGEWIIKIAALLKEYKYWANY